MEPDEGLGNSKKVANPKNGVPSFFVKSTRQMKSQSIVGAGNGFEPAGEPKGSLVDLPSHSRPSYFLGT
jgi:hypothetical protein